MKIDQSLFTGGQHALNDAYGNCPKCDSELRLKHVNKSTFLSCSAYPACDFTQSLQNAEVTVIKEMQGSSCPECENVLAVKKGRYGMFIGCTSFPSCSYIASKNNNADKDQEKVACPKCDTGQLVERQNKFGKAFFACDAYPRCKYMLNDRPVQHVCKDCAWPIMIQKSVNGEITMVCPQLSCGKPLGN